MADIVKNTIVVGTAAGVTAKVAVTAILTKVGFTTAGVAAGSWAAGIQSGIGAKVVAGSLFSSCQAAGAVGGVSLLGPVGLGAAAFGSMGYLVYLAKQRFW